MQRISQRENIFLGYAAQNSYESPTSLPRSPFRSSDVDFNDVFGGPPRRFSHHSSDGGMDSEETGLFRGLSSEKPVFGEGSSVIRRKPGQSNDFFDDIFRGEKFSSSPKRDFVNSLPGSRVMSPSSSLPRVKSEPFGTTLPAQFSLPATLTKAMDYPTFASGSAFRKKESTSNNGITSPNSPLSRPSNCPSSLSNEFSLRNEESSWGNLKDDSKITETPTDINEFHFSIYKWTSSRVPIVMPLRKRISSKSIEKDKFERCSSSKRRIKIDAVDELLPANACDTGTPSIAVNSESSKMECHIVKEEVLINPKPEFLEITKIIVENVPDYTILSNKSEETRPNSLPDISLSVETEREVSMVIEEVHKPELKPLHSILSDEIERQGNEDIIMKVEGKENVGKTTKVSHSKVDARENVKKHDEKKINSNITEMNKPSIKGSPKIPGPPGGNLKRSGVRGKVKDIVKIFNHNTYTRNQSSRWDGKDIGAKVNKTSVGITEMNTEMASPNANKIPDPSSVVDENVEQPEKPHSHVRSPNVNKILDASFIVDENVEQPKKLHSYMKSKTHTISDIPSYQQEASPFSVSIPDDSKVTSGNIDDLFQVNYMIQELSNDQVKLTQTNEDLEATKALDAKILKWSSGKKGNIRSLLSTLQYVLWPESGWKPVPLVNIIEGSAVKRAYQRALFYLHPDKLQQKGATSHQKYMAQKVFDILQEAWDHFNSLGSI